MLSKRIAKNSIVGLEPGVNPHEFCVVARTPPSVVRCDNDTLNASNSIDVQCSRHPDIPPVDGSETARTPLSDTRHNIESMDTSSIVGLVPSHRGLNTNDVCEVTSVRSRIDVGYNSNQLDVGNDIVSNMPRHPGLGPGCVCGGT